MNTELFEYILPSELLKYFIITQIEEKPDKKGALDIYIELEEINQVPEEYTGSEYESKGFFPLKKIQDFPMRGKAVYLMIKRRRWRHKINKTQEIHRDCSFLAKGVKLTQELSDFLKATGRDPRRYD